MSRAKIYLTLALIVLGSALYVWIRLMPTAPVGPVYQVRAGAYGCDTREEFARLVELFSGADTTAVQTFAHESSCGRLKNNLEVTIRHDTAGFVCVVPVGSSGCTWTTRERLTERTD